MGGGVAVQFEWESGVLVGLCRGSHQRWVPTAGVSFPHRHDWALPRLSGLTAPQTVDDPRTPPRRWWEGNTAVPVCVRRARPGQGGGGRRVSRGGAWPYWCHGVPACPTAHPVSLPCLGPLHTHWSAGSHFIAAAHQPSCGVVRRGATRARVDMFAEDRGSVLVSKA